jgi:hypothetical protein
MATHGARSGGGLQQVLCCTVTCNINGPHARCALHVDFNLLFSLLTLCCNAGRSLTCPFYTQLLTAAKLQASAHQLVLQSHVRVHLKLQPTQLYIQPVADPPALQQCKWRCHSRQPSSLRDVIILIIASPRPLLAGLQEEGAGSV